MERERPIGAPVAAPARAWPRGEDLPALAYYAAVALVLGLSGFPAWRIAVLVALPGAAQAWVALFSGAPGARRHDPRRCVTADPETVGWWAARTQASVFVATAVTVALTGGARSPLLFTLLAAYLGAASMVGDRRPTRLLLAATALAVCALALLPSAWKGPALAPAVHAVLAALSVLGLATLLAPAYAMMRRRRRELARWRAEMAADALARARTFEQIGANVAHELYNPLAGVKAMVQLGLRNPREAASHDRLRVMAGDVDRMQEILEGYLSFARPLQVLCPRPVELEPLVSDALVVLAERAREAGVRLLAAGGAAVQADPRLLREALLGLVANAIEATARGGEVAVEVRRADGAVEIAVRDTGRGMTPETLRRVGTPFFSTREEGAGLGVALARAAVAQHGGTLRYESEPGRGTRACITLPAVPPGGLDAARADRG